MRRIRFADNIFESAARLRSMAQRFHEFVEYLS